MARTWVVLRAYFLWALLLGQAALIGSWLTGWGWIMLTQSANPAAAILGVLAASGLIGLVVDWLWLSRFGRGEQA